MAFKLSSFLVPVVNRVKSALLGGRVNRSNVQKLCIFRKIYILMCRYDSHTDSDSVRRRQYPIGLCGGNEVSVFSLVWQLSFKCSLEYFAVLQG